MPTTLEIPSKPNRLFGYLQAQRARTLTVSSPRHIIPAGINWTPNGILHNFGPVEMWIEMPSWRTG